MGLYARGIERLLGDDEGPWKANGEVHGATYSVPSSRFGMKSCRGFSALAVFDAIFASSVAPDSVTISKARAAGRGWSG